MSHAGYVKPGKIRGARRPVPSTRSRPARNPNNLKGTNMELGQVVGLLIRVGASYPSDTDEYKAVMAGAVAVMNIDQCFGAPDNETLVSARESYVQTTSGMA